MDLVDDRMGDGEKKEKMKKVRKIQKMFEMMRIRRVYDGYGDELVYDVDMGFFVHVLHIPKI